MPGIRLSAIAFLSIACAAQDPVHWNVTADPSPHRAGEVFTVNATAQIDPGWHIYSVTQGAGGPFPTRFVIPAGPFRLSGAVASPKPVVEMDPNFGIQTETLAGNPVFRVPVQVTVEAPGTQTLHVNVRYQACDESNCLPPRTDKLSLPIALVAGRTASTDAAFPSFLWLAVTMGALSLLTPCVFPMVPITVSYFTNHAAARRSGAVRDAAIYALGIVLTFTGLGLALAALFGAAGINKFAANPWVNLAITGIFLMFALSLFGVFHLAVPSSVLTRLDAVSRAGSSGNTVGLLLMGLTFSLTSFTCTAPFVGTLLVMASQGQWLDPALGLLAFSTTFAAPFFVLALAPQLVSQLPKAGNWMNSVKVVMGLLEVAAAMKFLSNADLIWRWGIFTRDTVLVVWIAAGILIVLYVAGIPVLPQAARPRGLGAIRIAVAAAFFVITIALIPGLFGGRLGEIDSFLPPGRQETTAAGSVQAADGLRWILNDLDTAREQARREQKLVFVDFTGYTCTNCRWMEINMFPRTEVRAEIARFVTVRLYTDGEGAVYERQQRLQQNLFHTVALPLYAILNPDGAPVASFSGLTRNPADFLDFLHRGL